MYTDKNYKTKKALVEDFKAGKKIGVWQPGGVFQSQTEGWCVIEGPQYPEPHRFYVKVFVEGGIITQIK